MKARCSIVSGLLLVGFFQLPFWGAGAELTSNSFSPDPELNLEEAWISLQSLLGAWASTDQNYVEWEQENQTFLKKTLKNGKGQREVGRLIKKDDKIIYQLRSEEEQFNLRLRKVTPKSWIFEAETDQLLQAIELTLTADGTLRVQTTAFSPSGRRMTMHSEMNRYVKDKD